MRNTDINKFSEESPRGSTSATVKSVAGKTLSVLLKVISTVLLVTFVTGLIVGISMIFYLIDLSKEELDIDLRKIKSNQTSFIYTIDENGEEKEYLSLYSSSNSVWVDYNDIPKAMKDAMVAIEDKRFYEHSGVDWVRTTGAILSLATGRAEYGGSTLTQQLIKNVTSDNDVSLTRKLREIFRALNLEKEYTKDEILEAYLNVVNFGSGCNGVQAAADLYFGKEIKDCSIAECAAIAGITQNPAAYTPLVYPENNKERREIVLSEMYNQGKITEEEYNNALEESKNMKFIGYTYLENDDEQSDWNWYIDRLFRDIVEDLQKNLGITSDVAERMIYSGGLRIYSAMDEKAQTIAEKKVLEWQTPEDESIQCAFIMMDFEGRVLATVGSRTQKEGRLLLDRASGVTLQPGSSIKPVASYAPAIDAGYITYSSLIPDEPVSNWDYDGYGNAVSGPNNWYRSYYGNITVTRALNISSNATAVQVLNMIGLGNSYDFVTNKLHFSHLDPDQDSRNLGGLSIGGLHGGVTVEEMTAAYQMFCNGGYCYEPYTYYYVTDSEGEVILDNRDRGRPERAISEATSSIMNRLLSQVVNGGGESLGYRAIIDGWDIIGKTGTTDDSYDNWFVGASPYAVAGCWMGHDTPGEIPSSEQNKNHYLWRDIMQEWLQDKEHAEYTLSDNVVAAQYCKSSGMLANGACGNTATGYYDKSHMPGTCTYCSIPEPQESSSETSNETSPDTSQSGEESSMEESSASEQESSSESTESPIENSTPSNGNDSPEGGGDTPTEEVT